MKKLFILIAILFILIAGVSFSQQNATQEPPAIAPPQDTPTQTVWFPFNGAWMPDQDASLIGPKNFKTLTNLRHNDASIEGVNGYSKINTSALSSYPLIRNGIQLTSDRTTASYVIVQTQNSSGVGELYYNTTAIPSQGSFSGTTLHQDTTGYDLPRFSPAPSGNMAYANSKESMIWAGDEMRVSGFFTVTDTSLSGPVEYTDAVNNTLQTAGNYVSLGPASGTTNWVVFSTRPLSGVKYYVISASTTATGLSGAYWSGTTWAAVTNASDGTLSGATSFAQTGTFTFDSTVSTAKPYYFQGLYLYAYRFALTAGTANVYHVSVKAPFQSIVDVWDGVFRQPTQFQLYHGSIYEDYTLEVNEASYPSIPIGADLAAMTSSDHFIVMFDERMAAVKFDILAGLANTNSSGVTVEYWNGTAYVAVTETDGTASGTTTFAQSGVISWTPPSGTSEFKQTLFGITGYAYRFTVSETLSGTHDGTDLIVDQVTGIPAQMTVKPFRFPSVYKNRLFLAGYTEGKEGNRVDFSSSNAPNVWNGEDSSADGLYSLYFGGSEPLTAGTQLYNRFGSNIFSTWVAFKETETYLLVGDTKDDFKIYPISHNLGCPAPLTVATAELGFEVAQEAQRNVVMWLSNRGPMMFDGAVFSPIKGVDKYFDPVNADSINSTYFKNSRGWYDPNYKEYNLLIPSTTSGVTNNLWLVYDLQRKKWFKKDTGTGQMPQAAWQAIDTNGKKYIYGGIDTGYMVRLENSYRWDETAITQTVETGDFYPTQSPWEITRLRRIKLAAKVTSENADVTVTHYNDTDDTSGVTVALVALDTGTGARVFRETQPVNSTAWSHRLKFSTQTTATLRGFSPILWGMEYLIQRADNTTTNPYTETPSINQVSDGRSKYYVNYASADQGVDDNSESLKDLCDSVIGASRRATVVFKHWRLSDTSDTTYTLSTALDLSSYTNINFEFEKGAVVSGVTLTLPDPANVMAEPSQQIVTAGTVLRFAKGGDFHVGWWNAKGDGDIGAGTGTNDYAAVLAACEAARALYDTDITKSPWVVFQNSRTYRLESTLFLGRNASNSNWVQRIKGNGAILWGVHTGGYVLDYTGAHGHIIENLTLHGDSAAIPLGGLLKSRMGTGSGGQLRASQLDIQGTYSVGALIIYASEENHFLNCNFEPLAGVVVAVITDTGYYKDSAGAWNQLDIPNDDVFSGTSTCMNNSFTACRFWNRKAAPSSAAAIVQLVGADRVGFKSCYFDETANDMPIIQIAQDTARGGTRGFYNNFSDCTFHGTYESAVQVDGCTVDYLSVKNCKMGTSSIADIYASAANSILKGADIQCNDIDFSATGSDIIDNSHLNVTTSLNVAQIFNGEAFITSGVTLTIGDLTFANATVHITDTGETRHYGSASHTWYPDNDSGATIVGHVKYAVINSGSTATQTLWSYTLADEESIIARAYVSAKMSQTSRRAMYGKSVYAYRDGAGVATIQGTEQAIFTEQETDAAMDARFTVSGNDLLLVIESGVTNATRFIGRIEYETITE